MPDLAYQIIFITQLKVSNDVRIHIHIHQSISSINCFGDTWNVTAADAIEGRIERKAPTTRFSCLSDMSKNNTVSGWYPVCIFAQYAVWMCVCVHVYMHNIHLVRRPACLVYVFELYSSKERNLPLLHNLNHTELECAVSDSRARSIRNQFYCR